ncbi:uncharacterized protein LOC129573642 [Sitodiplosis mosellana]|uniref:uncharacterized protein LOC129573642 n=1 Tax=Sitodiplosis mosellana TaxID=263140 RepID=UPI0024452B3B|nr:uncharacterized protein LOC129573642 [Sitodiplosis mosellana]
MIDSMSASVLFNKPKQEQTELSPEDILAMYRDFFYEVGVDPGLKTRNASVRRTIDTEEEKNIKISSKRYHWVAKQPIRNRIGKHLTADSTKIEQDDLKAQVMPSPRGSQYMSYIRHRLRMLLRGMAAYATRQYARLRLAKYIQSTRS